MLICVYWRVYMDRYIQLIIILSGKIKKAVHSLHRFIMSPFYIFESKKCYSLNRIPMASIIAQSSSFAFAIACSSFR
jgi:hypothetical protein